MLNSPSKERQSGRQNAGFTLIELLVVVAVIALLIGILLPALGAARRSAYQAQGANTQRQLVLGMIAYSSSNNEQIPGVNTSAKDFKATTNDVALSKSGEQPITQWDWMSPALDAADVPQAWAERTHYLFETYRDPTMNETVLASDVNGATPELTDLINSRGMPTASYLMPSSWQVAGRGLNTGSQPPFVQPINENSVFQLPDTYRPRLSNFGGGSRKVAIADGVPGASSSSALPSLDLTIWDQSTLPLDNGFVTYSPSMQPTSPEAAYDPNSDRNSLNYRHSGGMNVTRWDGSGTVLSIQESYDPSLWYPPNTVYGGGGRPEVTNNFNVRPGDIIR